MRGAATRLTHTDDTALALVLAAHLARRRVERGLDRDVLALEFAAAWRAEPWRGYGSGAAQVLGLIGDGASWRSAARATFGGQGSYGNGAAMRVAPVALVASSVHHAAELGRQSAEVTHGHEHGQLGAACQAAAAYLALHGDRRHRLDATRFLQDLARVIRSRPWHERFDRISELIRHDASPAHAARALGNDVSALGSVPLALLAFLTRPDDAAAAIRFAVLGGGDADTIASMAGALAGARNGAQVFSESWITRLEAAEPLSRLTDQMAGPLPARP
ncbi:MULTISPECIES: ADP-ribosylglycohydrolase family protein [Lentzea]|uniref:Poly(ADP-ribose) glycohydrolase ARH3 n=2 Tax=Lentzea TaxID=165301 RepID=A0A1W2ALP3_9PSEU|nr:MULTISPECIES: ADP-ribosylglycohydrolase family protein [Lentzea]MDX8140487.1 ADP-ribosylglycohydrolase family protein [Lentzea sp. BCCO 10_0061]SMC61605.1 poly(ADP-ribose) glycohydrolase ARH3 [Lentzea albidocapillata]